MTPVSERPVTLVDKAANDAMEVIEQRLETSGAKARHILIVIDGEKTPDGEPNATVAGHGYADDKDLLAQLLLHAAQTAREMVEEMNRPRQDSS